MAKQTNPDFLNGVPELLVLQLLARRAMYGYELVRRSKNRAARCWSLVKGAFTRFCIDWKATAIWRAGAIRLVGGAGWCIA